MANLLRACGAGWRIGCRRRKASSHPHTRADVAPVARTAWRINEQASAFLFPGFLPLLLAALAFAGRPRNTRSPAPRDTLRARATALGRDPATFYAWLTLGAVLLASGPPLGLWPFVYWLPGMNFVRVPSRFMILAVLGLAVLAGLGFDRVTRCFAPHSMAHWQRTVHGYSGMRAPLHDLLYKQLTRFPDEPKLHVTYIVVHINEYQPGEWPAIDDRLGQYQAWLALEYQDRDARVYSLLRGPSGRQNPRPSQRVSDH
jgi:hypothetical protein